MVASFLFVCNIILDDSFSVGKIDGKVKDVTFLSPYFQGVLMEVISSEYACLLHQNSINPYTLRLFKNNSQIVWQIVTFSDESYNKIILPILKDNFSSFYLKYLKTNVVIDKKTIIKISLEEISNVLYKTDIVDVYTVDFLTPTAFRSQGQYVFYPNVRLIMQSLIMKYGYLVDGEKDVEKGLLTQLETNVNIIGYNINSRYMPLGQKKIPAFVGSVTFKITGTDFLKNYFAMLLEFGQYSGVGIKTSMGMGMFRRRKNG
ncbi:MAG: CRISPR-associated endoribonuclease Cas6 [Candidatus Ancillula sp.]|nr:CRISPR-associated endoribonuclease Cas6 [Candidatus Ancillula sp.]